jgi:hypothetical protein
MWEPDWYEAIEVATAVIGREGRKARVEKLRWNVKIVDVERDIDETVNENGARTTPRQHLQNMGRWQECFRDMKVENKALDRALTAGNRKATMKKQHIGNPLRMTGR